MIIYGSSLSPYVRKVLVICAEKGLSVDNQVFGQGIPPTPEFLEASPFGKIPALRDDDGFTLSDSTAIAVYLDAKHPQPQLIPTEPRARGRTLWFDEFADTISVPSKVKVFFNRVVAPLVGRPADEAAASKAESDELPAIFAYLERSIPPSGFLVEDRFTLADIAVASPFVNLRHAKSELDAATYPKLTAYLAGIHARPSFAALIGKDDAFLERARARAG